ncbi:VanW family protein [Neomicrococcus lactis]
MTSHNNASDAAAGAPGQKSEALGTNGDYGRGSRKKSGWIIAGATIALLACGYGGAAYALQDRVPTDAKVEGVEVGGMSRAKAVEKLQESFDPVTEETFAVVAGDNRGSVTPKDAGLSFDYSGTLDGLTGFTLNPVTLYQRAFGGAELQLKKAVDTAALENSLKELSGKLNQKAVEGSLSVAGAHVTYKAPVPGHQVDLEETKDAISQQWGTSTEEIEAVVDTVKPATPESAFTEAKESVEKLLSGNITVAAGDYSSVLTPTALANATSFTTKDAEVNLVLDNTKINNAVVAANSKLKSTARDASVQFKDGKPVVVPGQVGRAIDSDGLNEKVLTASTTSERKTTVDFKEVKPEVTTEEVESWRLTKKIVEFSTPYPTYDTTRTKNLVAGAKKITGDIVQPGEVFSLSKALGPITKENGYFESGVVEDGFSSKAVGGGLSQISTQMFNVGFLGGMDDVTHQPHSRWFDRYPAGREATLWSGQIDMKWRNSTDHPVLIQTYVTNSRVVSVLWGTKKWDVKVSSSGPYNQTNPKTVYNSSDKCVPESGGQKGFTIDTTRTRTHGSTTLPKDRLRWTYQPWNKVVCGEDPNKK